MAAAYIGRSFGWEVTLGKENRAQQWDSQRDCGCKGKVEGKIEGKVECKIECKLECKLKCKCKCKIGHGNGRREICCRECGDRIEDL